MKAKLPLIFSLILLILSPEPSALSQIPQGFNYQAIVRNASGVILQDKSLKVSVAIKTALSGGIIIWEESHNVTSNQSGMVSFAVGTGTRVSGTIASFDLIDWKAQPLYLKTTVEYPVGTVTDMGTAQILSVPYSLVAKDVEGPIKKLDIKGTEESLDSALFEVKNKNGQTIFAVYNEGVRIYVDNGAKGGKGGFAVGGFDMAKGTKQTFLAISDDSVKIYIDSNPLTKKPKGGFAVGGFDMAKGTMQDYFVVEPDSIRAYIDTNPTKSHKGGFAVGGFDMAKDASSEFFRVTSDSVKVSKSLLIPRLTTLERDNLSFAPGEALIIFNMTEGCMQIYKNNVWSNIWCFNCAPAFIIQPVDNTICSGNNVIFFISATGTNLSYQWQESTDKGSTWNNISNGGSNPAYSGAKGYTLTLSNVPVGYHLNKYRCVIAGSCLPNVISNVVSLNVGSTPPVITSQPTDQQLAEGCSSNFSIVSPGYIISYQWQQSSDGGSTWSNISDGGTSPVFSGSTSSVLSLSNAPLAYHNYKYRCIVSNLCGAVATSVAATLTINSSPAIISQPLNTQVYARQNTTFSITTSGSGYNLQWQVSINGGSTWTNVTDGGSNPVYMGASTSSLSLINVPWAYNNYKYRCVVIHYCRPGAISDAATLLVPSVTDIEGNTYNTIGIGTQIWMAENLKTSKYNDGTAIPLVTDSATWANLVTPGYCWYNNNEVLYKNTYGALYNWYTVNTGNLCPSGWHAPSDGEWTTLVNYLIANNYNFDGTTAGNKIAKAMSSTTNWTSSLNEGVPGNDDYPAYRNKSGFTVLPGGCRNIFAVFASMGNTGYLSTNTAYNSGDPWVYYLNFDSNSVSKGGSHVSMKSGFSVRCIKD